MAVMKIVEVDISKPWYFWMQELERKIIQDELNTNGYSIAEAARTLGLNRSTLHEKINKLGIERHKELKKKGIQCFQKKFQQKKYR